MRQMFIDGTWTSGRMTERISVVNPATEEVVDEVPRGTAADVEAAVEAARSAFNGWRRASAHTRAALLLEAAARLRAAAAEIARLLTLEQGKPLRESEDEIAEACAAIEYYAGLARHEIGRVIPPDDPDQLNLVWREPYGVVACIVPWNFPVLLLAWKIAPALASGNTVVIKPSEHTPLTTLRTIEMGFSEFPRGVVNVVTGYGLEAGEPLVRDARVPMIAFTGSLATGQRIAATAAPLMKKLHLELGGKDPLVVAPDADLETAVRATAWAGLMNAGQVCTSAERVYVQDAMFDRFIARLCEFVGTLRVGDGLDPTTDIGPMLRAQFRERVEAQIAGAVQAGATVLVGGTRPADRPRGYFLEPAVVVDVDHSMAIMRDETFGPVVPVMRYREFDEAIGLANDTIYGLGASLLTHDARLVKKFCDEVKAGTIWINDPLADNVAAPFGGTKLSGRGRELGQEGLDEFTEVKHLHWDTQGGPKRHWYRPEA
jgi:acyl-CoA reductase-like NAD-dependent aldehyde dehydrogenase